MGMALSASPIGVGEAQLVARIQLGRRQGDRVLERLDGLSETPAVPVDLSEQGRISSSAARLVRPAPGRPGLVLSCSSGASGQTAGMAPFGRSGFDLALVELSALPRGRGFPGCRP
jgi:hypothetical protein